MKNLKKILALIITVATTVGLCACAVIDSRSDKLMLFKDGQSDYRIVIADGCTNNYKNAASELQKYIKDVTGAELPVVTDAETEQDKEIIIGLTNRGDFGVDYEALGKEGYTLLVSGNKVVVAGGKRGCIYGAYGLLKQVFGCRFYATNCEIVPSKKNISIATDYTYTDKPVIQYRYTYWAIGGDSDSDLMKRGMTPSTADWGADSDICANGIFGWGKNDLHTINYLLNDNEDGTLHTMGKQPCVSCKENYDKILATALKWIGRRLDEGVCDYINISQNDGTGGWCTCELCTEYNNLYGNGQPTGSWWYFINKITKDIHDVYPDVEVRTYAYSDTAEQTSLDIDSTVTAYVSAGNGGNCCIHGLDECACNKNIGTADNIKTWSQKLNKFYVFDYLGCSGEFNMYFPNLYGMKKNYKLFADCGAYGVLTFGTENKCADFTYLRYYLLTQLMWNPYITDAEYDGIIDGFCRAYYGFTSGGYIYDYLQLFQETFSDRDIIVDYAYKIEDVYKFDTLAPRDYIFPANATELYNNNDKYNLIKVSHLVKSDFFDKAHEIFDNAREAADSEEHFDRVKLNEYSLDYLECYVFYRCKNNLGLYNDYIARLNKATGINLAKSASNYVYMDMITDIYNGLNEMGVTAFIEGHDLQAITFNAQKLPRNWWYGN